MSGDDLAGDWPGPLATFVGVAGRGDIVHPEGVGFPDYAAVRPGGTSVTWAVAWPEVVRLR